jgi:hypothetical protein
MFMVKLHFHRRQEVELPKNITLVEDHGVQSIYVMDGPRKRFYGRVLTVKAETKAEIDEWLKNDSEVYIDDVTEHRRNK